MSLRGSVAAQTEPAPAPAAPTAAQKFELPPLDELQATRERPLFSPTRRPPEIAAEPEAAPPITESVSLPFELTGIALGDEIRIAILHNKTTNEELRVREGDKVDDWMLETVADRFILLRGDGRRLRVWLFDSAKKAGIKVRAVDGSEESSAEAPADQPIDQEVLPDAAPSSRVPNVPPPPPPKQRVQRPPGPLRTAPVAGPPSNPLARRIPPGKPQMRRN